MAADPHDWRTHEGGYPWPDVALPCREDPDLLDGLHLTEGVSPYVGHCDRCPVVSSCVAYALEHNIMHGTWGGTTGEQRRETLRRLRRKHG